MTVDAWTLAGIVLVSAVAGAATVTGCLLWVAVRVVRMNAERQGQ